VNSCQGLVQNFVFNPDVPLIRAIAPVLVIPTGLLWQVDYTNDGKILTPPRNVDRTTLFLNGSWTIDRRPHIPFTYRMSHIELVTLGALPDAVKTWMGPTGFFSKYQR
jgi:hypothetical protein